MSTGLGPIPMHATPGGAEGELFIDFDLPLTPGPLNAANWLWYYAGGAYTCVTATAAGVRVTCLGFAEDPTTQPDAVSYSPPPFDVTGTCHGLAKAFSMFPIT